MEKMVVYLPFKEHHKKMLEDAAAGRLEIVYSDNPADLADADIVAGHPAVSELADSKKLKWIQVSWAGADIYTLDPAFDSERITVSNMRGIYGPSVSEYIVAGLMACCRNFQSFSYKKEKHEWNDSCRNLLLHEKTALILGVGDIGGGVAKKLKGFDVHTIGFARSSKERPYLDEVHTLDVLDEYLPKADFVCITLPADKSLSHLIGEKQLRLMKKDAVLVNAGRGLIVDNAALAKVMNEGHLFGACLDVFEDEPLPPESPLWDIPNLIITPHVAGVDFGVCMENEDWIAAQIAENTKHYLDTGEMNNAVNRF